MSALAHCGLQHFLGAFPTFDLFYKTQSKSREFFWNLQSKKRKTLQDPGVIAKMIRPRLNVLFLFIGVSVVALGPDLSDIRTDTVPADFTESGQEIMVTYNVTQQVAAAQIGLAKADYPDYSGNVTADALNLVYWDGCDLEQQSEIYAGWYDAYKIMTQNKDGVPDWNEAAALEYLGANGLNNPQHGQISCQYIFLTKRCTMTIKRARRAA